MGLYSLTIWALSRFGIQLLLFPALRGEIRSMPRLRSLPMLVFFPAMVRPGFGFWPALGNEASVGLVAEQGLVEQLGYQIVEKGHELRAELAPESNHRLALVYAQNAQDRGLAESPCSDRMGRERRLKLKGRQVAA